MPWIDPAALNVELLNSPRHQRYIFMLGSALSLPTAEGGPGVPGVAAMVTEAKRLLDERQRQDLERRLAGHPAMDYQLVMEFLAERRGHDTLNQLILDCTLRGALRDANLFGPFDSTGHYHPMSEPEEITEAWHVPPGLEAFGKLVALLGHRYGESVLTTNFDPLIEMGIRRAGGQYFRICASSGGDLRASGGSVSRIVHLHGYFHNSETLHTTAQIRRERPYLKDSLKMLLVGKTVVVAGYGGWDDLFMEALLEIALEPGCGTRIIWCFHEGDRAKCYTRYQHVLGRLAAAEATDRLTLVNGFDVNACLPEMYSTLSMAEVVERAALRVFIEDVVGRSPATKQKRDALDRIFSDKDGLEVVVHERWNLTTAMVESFSLACRQSGMMDDTRIVSALVERWLKAFYGDSVQIEATYDESLLTRPAGTERFEPRDATIDQDASTGRDRRGPASDAECPSSPPKTPAKSST